MNIRVSVDTTTTQKLLANYPKQVRFATALALTRTAQAVREAEIAEIRSTMKVRQFDPKHHVRIEKATKDNLVATVKLEGPGRKPSFLTKFVRGGVIHAPDVGHPFAIPSDEFAGQKIPRSLYPKSLGLIASRTASGIRGPRYSVTRNGVVQYKGKQRTFVQPGYTLANPPWSSGKFWGVFQRETRADIRMLWTYKMKLKVPPLLNKFYDVAHTTVARVWPQAFGKAAADAIRTAR